MFLVGNKQSAKRNNWMALCKDRDEAVRVQKELGPKATVIKEITRKKGATQ
jgi:hypothetical protein